MRTVVDVSFAENRVALLLKDLQSRQHEQSQLEEQFALGKNYSEAAMCRGRITGMMMAENLIREELQQLARFKTAVIEAET